MKTKKYYYIFLNTNTQLFEVIENIGITEKVLKTYKQEAAAYSFMNKLKLKEINLKLKK